MAEKTPVVHYDHFTTEALIEQAKIETEIRWRRKGSTERWAGFAGRVIGDDFSIDVYPNALYDIQIRRRIIGEEEWGEWSHHEARGTSHVQAREYRRKMEQEADDGEK